jgi:hypothetical protein
METILEILFAAFFTNWKKVKRVFSKKKEPEKTASKP